MAQILLDNVKNRGKDMILTLEERRLVRKLERALSRRALAEERARAREKDRKRIMLDLEGLNFITFINFINFDNIPRQ
jgi:hypothetical protein